MFREVDYQRLAAILMFKINQNRGFAGFAMVFDAQPWVIHVGKTNPRLGSEHQSIWIARNQTWRAGRYTLYL